MAWIVTTVLLTTLPNIRSFNATTMKFNSFEPDSKSFFQKISSDTSTMFSEVRQIMASYGHSPMTISSSKGKYFVYNSVRTRNLNSSRHLKESLETFPIESTTKTTSMTENESKLFLNATTLTIPSITNATSLSPRNKNITAHTSGEQKFNSRLTIETPSSYGIVSSFDTSWSKSHAGHKMRSVKRHLPSHSTTAMSLIPPQVLSTLLYPTYLSQSENDSDNAMLISVSNTITETTKWRTVQRNNGEHAEYMSRTLIPSTQTTDFHEVSSGNSGILTRSNAGNSKTYSSEDYANTSHGTKISWPISSDKQTHSLSFPNPQKLKYSSESYNQFAEISSIPQQLTGSNAEVWSTLQTKISRANFISPTVVTKAPKSLTQPRLHTHTRNFSHKDEVRVSMTTKVEERTFDTNTVLPSTHTTQLYEVTQEKQLLTETTNLISRTTNEHSKTTVTPILPTHTKTQEFTSNIKTEFSYVETKQLNQHDTLRLKETAGSNMTDTTSAYKLATMAKIFLKNTSMTSYVRQPSLAKANKTVDETPLTLHKISQTLSFINILSPKTLVKSLTVEKASISFQPDPSLSAQNSTNDLGKFIPVTSILTMTSNEVTYPKKKSSTKSLSSLERSIPFTRDVISANAITMPTGEQTISSQTYPNTMTSQYNVSPSENSKFHQDFGSTKTSGLSDKISSHLLMSGIPSLTSWLVKPVNQETSITTQKSTSLTRTLIHSAIASRISPSPSKRNIDSAPDVTSTTGLTRQTANETTSREVGSNTRSTEDRVSSQRSEFHQNFASTKSSDLLDKMPSHLLMPIIPSLSSWSVISVFMTNVEFPITLTRENSTKTQQSTSIMGFTSITFPSEISASPHSRQSIMSTLTKATSEDSKLTLSDSTSKLAVNTQPTKHSMTQTSRQEFRIKNKTIAPSFSTHVNMSIIKVHSLQPVVYHSQQSKSDLTMSHINYSIQRNFTMHRSLSYSTTTAATTVVYCRSQTGETCACHEGTQANQRVNELPCSYFLTATEQRAVVSLLLQSLGDFKTLENRTKTVIAKLVTKACNDGIYHCTSTPATSIELLSGGYTRISSTANVNSNKTSVSIEKQSSNINSHHSVVTKNFIHSTYNSHGPYPNLLHAIFSAITHNLPVYASANFRKKRKKRSPAEQRRIEVDENDVQIIEMRPVRRTMAAVLAILVRYNEVDSRRNDSRVLPAHVLKTIILNHTHYLEEKLNLSIIGVDSWERNVSSTKTIPSIITKALFSFFSSHSATSPPTTLSSASDNKDSRIMVVAIAVGVTCVLMLLLTIAAVIARMNSKWQGEFVPDNCPSGSITPDHNTQEMIAASVDPAPRISDVPPKTKKSTKVNLRRSQYMTSQI